VRGGVDGQEREIERGRERVRTKEHPVEMFVNEFQGNEGQHVFWH